MKAVLTNPRAVNIWTTIYFAPRYLLHIPRLYRDHEFTFWLVILAGFAYAVILLWVIEGMTP